MSQTHELSRVEGIRHTLSHLLAAAVLDLYPGAKMTTGPAVENGFYEDFDMNETIKEEDLPKIEQRMRELLKTWDILERREVTPEEARKQFAWNPYKLELIDDFSKDGKQLTFYISGEFIELCRGGHIDDAREINHKAFKLTKVSGAYWRGDQTKQQLQRVYGVAFEKPNELKSYLLMLEEAKKRDHRKLGQELDLFVFSDLVGAGLPLFTPRGTVLREELVAFSNQLRLEIGFEKVWIPHMTKKDLYEVSGHWAKFGGELFLVKSQETSDQLVLKPMNCPHHTRIYASRQRSYRDMPVRYLETTTVYRDEKTGELGGLNRVRSITQDDSHVFCRDDQIESEIQQLLAAARRLYKTVDMSLRVRLSYRDESDGYLGAPELWESAQAQLKAAVVANELNYFEKTGEAAFYGPKIDFMATDALGREHQVATVQLDFVQPQRFGLEYTSEDGMMRQPIMIHCALLGSIERFLAVYIEHTAGKFPIWLAPEQLRLVTVNQDEAIIALAEDIRRQAFGLGVRATVDASNESVGKKIRASELMKIPYTVVVGEKELAEGLLSPRIRKDLARSEAAALLPINDLLVTIQAESKARQNSSSF